MKQNLWFYSIIWYYTYFLSLYRHHPHYINPLDVFIDQLCLEVVVPNNDGATVAETVVLLEGGKVVEEVDLRIEGTIIY